MNSEDFTESMDNVLIEFVRVHPLLYQQKDPLYKEKLHKDKVWLEIATVLHQTVPEVKRRWRTIRDSYKKTKNKLESMQGYTPNGSFPSVKSKYNTQSLSFLDDSFKDRAYTNSKIILERLQKLSGANPMLLMDDSSSREITENKPEEPPPPPPPEETPNSPDISEITEVPDIKPIAEVIDLDDTDETLKDRQPPQNGEDYIIPDPIPPKQIETESNPLVHLRQLLVPESNERGVIVPMATETSNCANIGVHNPPFYGLPPPPPLPPQQPEPRPAKKRNYHQHPKSSEGIRSKRMNRTESSNSVSEPDEHPVEVFFRCMAQTVKTFPPHVMAETKMAVCKVVTQMELRCLAEQDACFGPRIVSTGSVAPDVLSIPP